MSAFLNRYCTSIAPYPGAFISLISTHQRLIYSSAPVSPFWRTQVVLASIRLFAAVFLTTLKRRGCSILRYMTTVVHLVCFSRVLRAAHVDPVRVHKRSPTLANHAFHCSQVASRSITVAVCGRSGCSSRLHSGYSSKIVKSSHPPRQKKFAVPLLPLRCPRQPQPQGFGRIASDYRWSRTTHEAFSPVLSVALLNLYPARRRLEAGYSRGFLACVVSSTAQFVSRSTAAHCCIHQCAGWRGVAARFSQQFTAGSLQTLLPSTVSLCSHLPAAGSLPAVFLHYLPSIQLIFGILSRTVDHCAHNFA
jgi:hypothetical protein